MHRFSVVVIICLLFFVACQKCSKGDGENQEKSQSIQSEKSEGQTAQNTSMAQESVDAGENVVAPHPNIRFVQTPDGKMVPEAAFKLKIPKMLNPQFLKGIATQQGEGTKQEKDEPPKEEKKE